MWFRTAHIKGLQELHGKGRLYVTAINWGLLSVSCSQSTQTSPDKGNVFMMRGRKDGKSSS